MAILHAARSLFAQKSYDEVSLNGIAREAGMSKPNIYRYFSSREEIFLQIFAEEQERLFHSVEVRLGQAASERAVESVVEIWVEEALKHPELMTLLPQLGTSLEKNSSLEQLVPFKKRAFERVAQLSVVHHRIYPRLSVTLWGEVLSSAFALMAGLWPLCNGGETVERAMQHPEVNLEPWDFETMLTFAFRALVLGASD